jgi:hypothetical protein
MVQKVQLRSANNAPFWNPGAFFTCLRTLEVERAKRGTKRMDRILRRVKLTKSIIK